MAFIPATNTIRIALEYTMNDQLVVNVYYVDKTTPIVTANLTQIAIVFRDWWVNTQRANFAPAILLQRVIATDVSVANGAQVVETLVTPSPGTLAGASTPNNVAIVVTHLTGLIGRSNRGRTFYAGINASDVTDNFISSTRQTALLSAETTLLSSVSSAGMRRVVVSYFSGGLPRTSAQVRQITGFKMNTRVDTQRRRLPGTGA